jgi:hypothetical protein
VTVLSSSAAFLLPKNAVYFSTYNKENITAKEGPCYNLNVDIQT